MFDNLIRNPVLWSVLGLALAVKLVMLGIDSLIEDPSAVVAMTQPRAPNSSPARSGPDTPSPTNQETAIAERESLQAMILAGADPTRELEATAAGNTTPALCKTGSLEVGDDAWQSLNGATYVSVTLNHDTFGKLITVDDFQFVQHEHQLVSANRIDVLPASVAPRLQQALTSLSRCEQSSKFIQTFRLEP